MQMTLLFTMIKQLCEGAVGAIVATQGKPAVMPKLAGMMELFSTVLAWGNVVKRSACRLGVMRGLELAKSYHPDMKPELLTDGFPEFNADGSPFSDEDYTRIIKETRVSATKIADAMDLSVVEPGYDERNKRLKTNPPEPVVFSLLPSSNPASSDKSVLTGEENDLAIEDLSDIPLYEGYDPEA